MSEMGKKRIAFFDTMQCSLVSTYISEEPRCYSQCRWW